jgi:hypothetical protein
MSVVSRCMGQPQPRGGSHLKLFATHKLWWLGWCVAAPCMCRCSRVISVRRSFRFAWLVIVILGVGGAGAGAGFSDSLLYPLAAEGVGREWP